MCSRWNHSARRRNASQREPLRENFLWRPLVRVLDTLLGHCFIDHLAFELANRDVVWYTRHQSNELNRHNQNRSSTTLLSCTEHAFGPNWGSRSQANVEAFLTRAESESGAWGVSASSRSSMCDFDTLPDGRRAPGRPMLCVFSLLFVVWLCQLARYLFIIVRLSGLFR